MLSKIHHVGLVVRDLETAYGFWRDALGLRVHKEATVPDQGVKAALLPCGDTEIELLEPIDPEGGVAKFLAKRGEGLHHVCLQSDDVANDLANAKANGLPMIDEKPRRGLAGMIGFLHPKASCGVLVEFAQPPPAQHAPGQTRIAFDHLAIVVDDVRVATEAFGAHFGLRRTDGDVTTPGGAVRMLLGSSAFHFYEAGTAPAALADTRGLAAVGLRVAALDETMPRVRPYGARRHQHGEAGAGRQPEICHVSAHGVPVLLRESRG